MFDTCTAANRIIDQPLITTFKFEFQKGQSGVMAAMHKYTRIRRASYKYIGCTRAAALQKAKELVLLYNRKVHAYWTRTSNIWIRSTQYAWVPAADVKVVLDHDVAYNVEVSLDEELVCYYGHDGHSDYWTAFEANPDLATDLFKYNGTGSSADFEYDGII